MPLFPASDADGRGEGSVFKSREGFVRVLSEFLRRNIPLFEKADVPNILQYLTRSDILQVISGRTCVYALFSGELTDNFVVMVDCGAAQATPVIVAAIDSLTLHSEGEPS